jgi:methionyl-tRNA synthetase
MITFDDFQKIELKIGKIISATPVEGSSKLLKLAVDFNETVEATPEMADNTSGNISNKKIRQVISGIAKQFPDPAVLVGKKYTFVTNLASRMIMGLESQAMIMAASANDTLALLEPTADIPEGTSLS